MIGILTEKPSAARNFATALGGSKGVYQGEEYVIVASRGHLYGLVQPAEQVREDLRDKYKTWNLDALPWRPEDFQWIKVPKPGAQDVLRTIRESLRGCDEIIIATDDDPTGEGELLAWEILDGQKLCGSKIISRMYFEDETQKSIQKAFVQRKRLPAMRDDPDFRQAYFRERWDFLSMQFSRVATLCGDGRSVLRQGRLKSAMVMLCGDQLKAVASYKKIPYYQNRFRDENGVVYTDTEEPMYKTEAEVPQKYNPSHVVVDSREMKHTAPPQMLDLSSLSAMLAARGIPAQTTLSVYQKLYEAHYVSYPRTEDKFISPEQFNELLPLVENIAAIVGVDSSLLTHRKQRPTHVKTGGAHGANRPGTQLPDSLISLKEYGEPAPLIYEVLAKNFLATLAEDYIYEAQKGHIEEYPSFIGRASVPQRAGWKAVFNTGDDKEEDENKAGLGSRAEPFVFTGYPKRPAAPTMKWLMKQLEKRNVGTGATRTSIYAEVTKEESGNRNKKVYPLLKDTKGKITFTDYGKLSYHILPNTYIGDLALTEEVQKQMRKVADGELDADQLLSMYGELIIHDIEVMRKNGADIPKVQNVERMSGVWNGQKVSFKRTWGSHRFSDSECAVLLSGGKISFSLNGKDGRPYKVSGQLAEQEYNGRRYIGFKKDQAAKTGPEKEKYSGHWHRHGDITFSRQWGEHRFTDEECEDLLAGKTISFSAVKKDGSAFTAKGKLAKQTYNGRDFIGFALEKKKKGSRT